MAKPHRPLTPRVAEAGLTTRPNPPPTPQKAGLPVTRAPGAAVRSRRTRGAPPPKPFAAVVIKQTHPPKGGVLSARVAKYWPSPAFCGPPPRFFGAGAGSGSAGAPPREETGGPVVPGLRARKVQEKPLLGPRGEGGERKRSLPPPPVAVDVEVKMSRDPSWLDSGAGTSQF